VICPNRSLYRTKGGRCCRLKALATGQGGSGGSLRGGSGGDFLRHHASALCIGRCTAGGYTGQAYGDYTLSIKPDLPRIGPKFPRSMHVASPKEEGRARRAVQVINEPSCPYLVPGLGTMFITG
jgi:hypothetical protein